MTSATSAARTPRVHGSDSKPAWHAALQRYQSPDLRKGITQILTSLVPLIMLWGLMVVSLRYSYLLTLLLAVPAAGLQIRLFIVQHDCGHGSFFSSSRANDVVGFLLGFLTMAPYHQWRHAHSVHHATTGRLEKRGTGDIPTMTMEEYRNASLFKRSLYRLLRHPLFLFAVAGPFLFMVIYRFMSPASSPRERRGVLLTNLAFLGLMAALGLAIGFKHLAMIELPIMWIATAAGTWLFYVQHQFEDAYWARGQAWDYSDAAFLGSSHYKLPKVLQWFTGNIGLHHIHHLNSRIPNYHLQRCHDEQGLEAECQTITLWSSRKCLRLRLWDEQKGKMVGFRELRQQRRALVSL